MAYRLPLLIESQLLVNHRGKFRLDLEKKFQWMRSVFSDVDFTWRPSQVPDQADEQAHHLISNNLEWEVSLMYGLHWSWALGLMLTDDSIGAGLQVQF